MASVHSSERSDKLLGIRYETILVAALPFLAYISSFAFEHGIAKLYKFPSNLIEISFTVIVLSVVPTLLFSIVLLSTLFILWNLIPKNKGGTSEKLHILFFLVSTLIIFWLPTYLLERTLFYPSAIVVIIILFLLLPSSWFVRKSRTKKKKKTKTSNSNSLDWKKDIVDNFSIYFLALLTFLSLLYSIVFSAGIAFESFRTNRQILSEYPDQLVLRIYGDKVITATFNIETKVVTQSFSIFNIDNNSPLKMETKKIGYITPICRMKKCSTEEKPETKK